jgi:hypothetical protein
MQAVPTNLIRQGNFSELLGPNPWYSGSHAIYDPLTCPGLGAASCVPFSGNIIPAKAQPERHRDPQRLPDGDARISVRHPELEAAHPYNQRRGTLSIDLLATDKMRISGRRREASHFEYQPFDQGSGETGKYFNRPNQTNTVSWTWTISPTLINEARATFSLDDVYIPVNTQLSGFNRSQFGINYPYLFEGKDIPGKIPSVNVPTFYSVAGGPYPSHSSGPIWTGADSLTKGWSNQTFKFGFSFEYSGENDGDQINVSTEPGGSNNQNGTFTFTDARTGLGAASGIGLANLALGLADSYTEIGPRAYTIWRGMMWEGFAQDSWKITPKLHIDYGIRLTSIQGFHPLWGNADYFDGSLYGPSQAVTVDRTTGNVILGTGNPYNGVVISGFSSFPGAAQGRVPAASPNNLRQRFVQRPVRAESATELHRHRQRMAAAPRYRLPIDPENLLRSGVGRFTTRMGLIDNIFPGGNSPFQPFVTVNNVSVDNPGASLTSGTAAALTITTLNRSLKPPEAWNWNFTVQRQLPNNAIVSVAYVAHRGLHAWTVYDINQPQAGALQAAAAGTNVNYLRPYKGFAAIQEEESMVNSIYNGFQVSFTQPLHKGLFVTASYTLSKSMDGGSNYRDIVPDTYNTSNLWSPSEYDTRHIFVVSYIYDLPFFKDHTNLKGKLLGGWEISGASQFQTGTPCGLGTNNDFAGVGNSAASAAARRASSGPSTARPRSIPARSQAR